ncbi:MAG: ABC transporter permease [Thermoproteota archaeon]
MVSILMLITIIGSLSNLLFTSGFFIVPVVIHLTGELESGSISEGNFFITSGVITIGNASYHVSTSPVEGYNGSLNYVTISSGKIFSKMIKLKNNYVIELAAVFKNLSTNNLYLSFGYGDPSGSTAISYQGRLIAFINATGVLSVSGKNLTLFAEGNALIPSWRREDLQKGCLLVVSKDSPLSEETVGFERWWQRGFEGWEDEKNYYILVSEGESVDLFISFNPNGRLAKILSSYSGLFTSERAGISVSISCTTGNTSISYLVVKSLKDSLENYVAEERDFLARVGFDADRYLKDIGYSLILLSESEDAFRKRALEVGSGLLEKSFTKIKIAIDALSQAKTDCIAMFFFLITFTFFLSSIVGAMFEKKKIRLNIFLFIIFVLTELTFIPQTRMAILLINPEVLSRLSPTSLFLSLLMMVLTLMVVIMVVLEAKGTLISDLFWYSVKSMRKRYVRTILTVATIAVVSAVSGSFLVVGTMTNMRVNTYPSEFRGLSVSSHVTTVTYIFRGLDQDNEVITEEIYEPIPKTQVEWLSSMDWVKKKYVVTMAYNLVSKGEKVLRALLIATNASKIDGVFISADLAEDLDAKEGDYIKIDGTEIKVSRFLDGPLILIDDVPIDEAEGNFVVTSLESLSQSPEVYRLLLEGDVPSDFPEKLIEISYEKDSKFTPMGGAQITVQTFRSLRVCYGTGSETRSFLIVGEFQYFSGAPELVVLMGLSSLMIIATLLGSIYEYQKEYSTINALGASPGQVSLLLLMEGVSYGLLGGVVGYLLSQFLQAYISTPVMPIKQYVFSPMLVSFLMAIVCSIIGSLIPARKILLQVVPSRFLLRRIEKVRLFEDHAEAVIPVRVVGDTEYFVTYVSSLTERSPPIGWGPIYMKVVPQKENDMIKSVDMTVSYRGERVATYKVQLILPDNPGSTIKAVLYSATGNWSTDHKFCAREMLSVLREDLLQYVAWKKQIGK